VVNGTPRAAALYLRISKDTVALGLGVDRQRHLCTRLAERLGWPIAATYEDNDISAYSRKTRPGYQAMCEAIGAGDIDGIVCVDLDRLTRHPRELEDVIDLAVPVALDSGSLDLTKSDDRMRARITGSVAAAESDRKSERIIRQKDDARRRGWWLGRPPYGYRTVPSGDGGRKLELVDAEAVVVRELARRVLAGETLMAAAQWASVAAGEPWSPMKVKRTLARPAAAGWQPDGPDTFRHPDTGLPVPVVHGPALLDEVTWRKVRLQFAGRRRTGVTGRSATVLLARLVECSVCGHAMSWGAGGSYICRTSFERGRGCVGNSAVGHRVDALVEALVVARLGQLADLTPTPPPDDGEVVRLGRMLEDQEAERRRLLLDGASPERVAALQATIEEVDVALRAARDRHDRATSRVDVQRVAVLLGDAPAARYREADVGRRREVVRLLVRRVVVAPAGGRTRHFDPGRVSVVLAD
jgi:site-specific DNA recombinase